MKKQVIAGIAAAMVCVGAVGGTFAYLTQTSAVVTNTFTVGNNVQISLDEAKVDELGEEIPGEKRVTENKYKLIPGHPYTKDPMVHIGKDSETCYVFIKVENGIEAIESEREGYTSIAEQITKNGWIAVKDHPGYYYKANKVDPDGEEDVKYSVFDDFEIDQDAYINEDENPMQELNLAGYTDKNITITACAVQADGFDSALEAVDAWPEEF